jgi:hypothetical protein
MGKSINSWNSYVGHIEHDGKNDSPEKRLFVAVLSQAAHDCFSIHVERHDKEQAKHFFLTDHFHFDLICELADRNPLYVKDKMRKKIIMNIDLPKMNGLKGYRRDQKKYKRKKCLTGNAYYAAKRKREEEHV